MNDYRRPADYQIENHYRCSLCGGETSVPSVYDGPATCRCGGSMQFAGESYPADSSEWDEYRDDVNDEWRHQPRR